MFGHIREIREVIESLVTLKPGRYFGLVTVDESTFEIWVTDKQSITLLPHLG